jgi:hypothetical protein
MAENDTPSVSIPTLAVEMSETTPVDQLTPEQAGAAYRQLMGDPSFRARLDNVHSKASALNQLEALAKIQHGVGSQGAKPMTQAQAMDEYRRAVNDPKMQRALEGRGGATAAAEARQKLEDLSRMASGEAPIDRQQAAADQQRILDETAPRSPDDFRNSVGDDSHPHAADIRQMLHENAISPQFVSLVAGMPGTMARAATLDDAQYDGEHDRAAGDVEKMPGGRQLVAKAVAMAEAVPGDHPLRKAVEAAMLTTAGIVEMARWSDRLRAKAGVR